MKSKFLQQVKLASDVTNTLAAIPPQSADGDAVAGIAIDRRGADSALIIFDAAAASGAPSAAVTAIKLQDCDVTTAGSFGDFIDLETALDVSTAKHKAYQVDLTGANRYIRVSYDSTLTGGTTPANVIAANVVLGDFAVDPPESVTVLQG